MPLYKNFYYKIIENKSAKERLVFLHGWGQDHKILLPLARYFTDKYEIILIDQYGCGKSNEPNTSFDSLTYAHLYEEFIKSLTEKTNIFIGHSYGARVIIQIASHYPKLVHKSVFIAGAGLIRERSLIFKIRAKLLKLLGNICKLSDKLLATKLKARFGNKFGSSDYKATHGLMREILVKAVTEDLTPKLADVKCPTLLLYGTEDSVTPPEFGYIFDKNIKNSKLILIDGADHNSILTRSYHQLQHLIEDFI